MDKDIINFLTDDFLNYFWVQVEFVSKNSQVYN